MHQQLPLVCCPFDFTLIDNATVCLSTAHCSLPTAQVTNQYWVEKYRKQDFQAFGTDEDREARIQDYLLTEVRRRVMSSRCDYFI